MREGRPAAFYWLALFFALYVLFLYGPMIAIFVLSFQGPAGGLTFPPSWRRSSTGHPAGRR